MPWGIFHLALSLIYALRIVFLGIVLPGVCYLENGLLWPEQSLVLLYL